MILFLDACAIIYLIEADAGFHPSIVATLGSLRARFPGSRLGVSRLSILECLIKPLHDRDGELIDSYRQFFAARDLLMVELDATVVETALRLRVDYGLRTPDALQAASALTIPSASHRFVTNDRRFERVVELESIQLMP
ncbi:MAG: PIN domain-containing protein [Thiohalocapsa sp.]